MMDGNVTNEDSQLEENFWLEWSFAGEKSHLQQEQSPNPFLEIEQLQWQTMCKNHCWKGHFHAKQAKLHESHKKQSTINCFTLGRKKQR